MGSWSVYCGISNIAITSGHECALLPLKDSKSTSDSYLPYIPATLPIFGEYDDYGGLENIKENENTKMIEEYFGISILDFTKIFTDWKTYERSEMEPIIANMKHYKELEDWKFMFIDKKVYDFMSTNCSEKGHLEFGNPKLLELIGFEYVGINNDGPAHDQKRFNQEWKFDNKLFYGDGTWLHYGKNDHIYYFNEKGYGKASSLVNQINVPEDKMWIGEKTMVQLWKIFSANKQKELLSHIIGRRYSSYDDMSTFMQETYSIKPVVKIIPAKSIDEKYIQQILTFGDGLAELVTVRNNLHPMSGHFAPFVQYLTPQCGEFQTHQKILNKFSEINKEYCRDYDDYEDEESE